MWFLDGLTSTNKNENDGDKIKDDDASNVTEAVTDTVDDSVEDINNSSNHTGTSF